MRMVRRSTRPPPLSRRIVLRGRTLAVLAVLVAAVIVGRAVQLQLVEGERWAAAAEQQHETRTELPARRGVIYDRNGVPLAANHEAYRISVAPRELRDPAAAALALKEGLGLSSENLAEVVAGERRWVVLPGQYSADQRSRLTGVRGLYFERIFERYQPRGQAAREVVGALDPYGAPLGGIEQQFDRILRGTPGYSILRRDPAGNARASISLPVVPPTEGADVHLTIDFALQEIARDALMEAIESSGALGGDLLIVDPRSGEILAAVSRRQGRARNLSAFTDSFEPGSTIKPFTAAALLAEGIATPDDTVYAERGRWASGYGRVIRDISSHDWLSLDDALRISSNIATVKFAALLDRQTHYQYLRDFGFGSPTGIEFPSESAGRLARPATWSGLTQASLSMGYELGVTPLQLVMAYGALANGGYLMEPLLVREIRASDGSVIARRDPVRIRRVIPTETATRLTESLVNVVEEGTAQRASMVTYDVAGKTGTARLLTAEGRYEAGKYTASFAGYFPARRPQLVVLVKLDEPEAPYYGGALAAPVSRATLNAVLAIRSSVLDADGLLDTRRVSDRPAGTLAHRGGVQRYRNGAAPTVFHVSDGLPLRHDDWVPAAVPVPTVDGLPLRDAVRRLHQAGLVVSVTGNGAVPEMDPAAGTPVTPGDTVYLVLGDGR